MKKNWLKAGLLFLTMATAVFWLLNFIFLNKQTPVSKASGEPLQLTFDPSSVTSAVNSTFTVVLKIKPTVDTTLRGYMVNLVFDKTKVELTKIIYNLGTASAGLGQTDSDIAPINGSGAVKLIGESQISTGQVLLMSSTTNLVTLTFKALSSSGASIKVESAGADANAYAGANANAYFADTDAKFYTFGSDMVLSEALISSAAQLDINGGGVVPTAGLTPTGSLTPTITGPITGNVKLNLKLKFQGITKLPATGENSMTVKVKVQKQGESTITDGTGTFVSDATGLWTGTVGINLTNVTGKYKILVKGPQHIQKKICDAVPTETSAGTYKCSDGNADLVVGDNNLNFSGIILLSGDLDQNGIVDSVDFGLVKNNLGKTDTATLATADINRDGIVDTQDYSLIIAALSIKSDEL